MRRASKFATGPVVRGTQQRDLAAAASAPTASLVVASWATVCASGFEAGPRSPNCSVASDSHESSNDTVPPPLARWALLSGQMTSLMTSSGSQQERCQTSRRIEAFANRRKDDLARWVDVVDANVNCLADFEDVFNSLDALACAQLGDVNQTVTARQDVHEGTELGDRDNLAFVGRRRLRPKVGS